MWALLARLLAWEPVANAIARWAMRRPADFVSWDGHVLARESRWLFNRAGVSVRLVCHRASCASHYTGRALVFTLIGALQTRDGVAHAGSFRRARAFAWERVRAVSPTLGAVELVVEVQ